MAHFGGVHVTILFSNNATSYSPDTRHEGLSNMGYGVWIKQRIWDKLQEEMATS